MAVRRATVASSSRTRSASAAALGPPTGRFVAIKQPLRALFHAEGATAPSFSLLGATGDGTASDRASDDDDDDDDDDDGVDGDAVDEDGGPDDAEAALARARPTAKKAPALAAAPAPSFFNFGQLLATSSCVL